MISQTETDASRDELARLAEEIARLEVTAQGWDAHHAQTLAAIKSSIEALNAEAFRRLIRCLKEDPAASARLNAAVRDPFVFGVLRFHGLVMDPLEHRVERALEEVRPLLREHGGDVELVAVHVPDIVEVRMTGACHGCPASAQTLTEGVERAIRDHCPEVKHVRQVSRPPPPSIAQVYEVGNPPHARSTAQVVHFVSPFAKPKEETKQKEESWQWLCTVESIPDGGVLTITHWGHHFLLYRKGEDVSCMTNACPHRGMPLDSGTIRDGVITCPYHDWAFRLTTGECLTDPHDPLTMHRIQVRDGHVAVSLPR